MTDVLLSRFQRAARALTVGETRAMIQYQHDPAGFLSDVLGIAPETIQWSLYPEYARHTWDGTPDPLSTMLEALAAGEDVGVESATGTGKSFTAAGIILWFLASWEGARVFTFAPKEDQLRLYIWAEMTQLWPRFRAAFPLAKMNDLEILMRPGDDKWGAWGYAVGVKADQQVAVNAQGMHAPHMLLVNEETPGIPLPVIEAQRNTATGAHNIRLSIGNPDSQQDALHQFCTEPGVRHIRISALDHPNVVTGEELIPGAVTVKSVERRLAIYGEGSRLAESRIRGISPSEAADALIKLEWVDAAIARYNDPAFRAGPRALGVDVANSEDGDQAAIARGLGACCLEVAAFPCPDANVLGAQVVAEAKADQVKPEHIGVDSVGVGAGSVNEAKRLGWIVQALNGGEKAWPRADEPQEVAPGQRAALEEELYANLRAQMHWQLRDDLQHGRIALPNDPELRQDLIAPTWWTKGGKIVVEAKEDIKGRLPGGRSPNKGDAVVYWNWVRWRSVEKPEPKPVDVFAPETLAAMAEASRKVVTRKLARRPMGSPPPQGIY